METRPDALGRALQALGRLTSLAFLVIVTITAYEVVMRYAFGAPTTWVHEITVALAACAFVIGGPQVHALRGHIAITYFVERMTPGTQRAMRIVTSVATLVCLAILTYAAVEQAALSLRDTETSGTALNLPTPRILKVLFAVACAIMTLQTVVHLVRDLAARRSGGGS